MFFPLLILLGAFAMATNAKNDENIVFINAKIFTGIDFSSADAFFVRDSRFHKLGKTQDIIKQFPREKTIDLKGALVLPGFIEAHAHFLGLGQSKLQLNLRFLQPEEIARLVENQAKNQPKGTWILGRGWDQNLWAQKNFPHKKLLNGISHPVYLRRVDGHAAFLNDSALALANITKDTIAPQGGQIIKDSRGEPTGVLIDNAMDLIKTHLNKPQRADIETHLDLASKEALSLGITSFHDAGVSSDALNIFIDHAQRDKLKVRIYAMIDGDDSSLVDRYLKSGPVRVNDFLSIRSIKYFADGALGSRGAFLLQDYYDQPGHRGLALISEHDLAQRTTSAINAGFQVSTHAIGDAANRLVLDAYQKALATTNVTDARLRIEHAQIVDPADHHRFNKMSIIASMQPIHCTSDMAWVAKRLSKDRIKDRAYPWRSLLVNKAILVFGSDAPVEDINPLAGIFAAVTRANVDDNEDLSFMPEQKLTLKEALQGYFKNAAFAEFSEHQKGEIKEGFLADFVVFNNNILHPVRKNFLAHKPIMTVVGGKIVFER